MLLPVLSAPVTVLAARIKNAVENGDAFVLGRDVLIDTVGIDATVLQTLLAMGGPDPVSDWLNLLLGLGVSVDRISADTITFIRTPEQCKFGAVNSLLTILWQKNRDQLALILVKGMK